MSPTPHLRPLWTLTFALGVLLPCSPLAVAQNRIGEALEDAGDDMKEAAAEVSDQVNNVVAGPAPGLAAALDRVDADAEIVLVIPSLSGLSEAVAEFGATTGLTDFAPDLDDALGTFKRQMSFTQGVDDDGAMLVVVRGVTESLEAKMNGGGDVPDPKAVMLIPVSDYDAFVKNLGGDPAQNIAEVTMKNDQKSVVKKLDGYALLGDDDEPTLIEAYEGADRGQAWVDELTTMLRGYAGDAQSLIYVDLRKLGPVLNEGVSKGLAEFQEQMQQMNADGADPMGMMGVGSTMMKLYSEAARTILDGTEGALFTFNLQDGGLGLTAMLQPAADSELAAFFTPAAKDGEGKAMAPGMVSKKLLASTPDRPYLYAAVIDQTAFPLDKLVDRIVASLEGEGEGQEAKFLSMYTDSLKMMKDTRGVASVFYAPEAQGMMTGGLFSTLTLYGVDDPEAFIAQQKASVEKLGELAIPLGGMQPPAGDEAAPAGQDGAGAAGDVQQAPAEMRFDTTYADTALRIEGVEVDQYNITMRFPPQMTQQFNPMLAAVAGGGYGGYIAPKDDTVLVTTVTDPQFITRAIQAVGKDEGIGTAGPVARLRDEQLPPDPMMELYVSLDGLGRTANLFLPLLGAGENLVIPDDLPPLAMGAAADGEGRGVAFRLFVPTESVTFGVDTYRLYAPDAGMNAQPGPAGQRAPR